MGGVDGALAEARADDVVDPGQEKEVGADHIGRSGFGGRTGRARMHENHVFRGKWKRE
jgi:hypothetical protein